MLLIKEREKLENLILSSESVNTEDFRYDGAFRLGDEELELSPAAQKWLLSSVGIPSLFWERLDCDIQNIVFNRMAKREKKDAIMHYRENGRKKVYGFVKPNSHIVPTEEIIAAIESVGAEGEATCRHVDYDFVRIDLLSPRQEEVAKGDMVQFGCSIAYSPSGVIRPMLSPLVLRLVCENGLLMQETKNGKRWKYDAVDKIAEEVELVFAEMQEQELVERFRHMENTAIPVEIAEDAFKRLCRVYRIPHRMRGEIWEIIEREGNYTEWAIINAITYYASHVASPMDGWTLSSRAGAICDGKHCRLCGQAVR